MDVAPKSAIKERPPIVVIVGHVDHGKTTLLDTIRKLRAGEKERVYAVTEEEAGGITQHIGAYEVSYSLTNSEQAKKITFIDTPGHEAFSAMRFRGTSVADIALLLVAADDGVKPQTKEALRFVKEAEIPFIVVITKIDKSTAQVERVKNELAENEVLLEGRGGKTPVVEVSAKEERGIDELLEIILLVAELEEFKYDAVSRAQGYVIESYRDPKRGIATNMVLTNGTLRTGDLLVCGPSYGKIKIMEDFTGESIKGAVPSCPLRVIGLNEISVAGDPCQVVESESEAKEVTRAHQETLKEKRAELKVDSGDQENSLTLIVKADTQGSLDAVLDSLRQIKSEKVGLKVAREDVGDISEGDIKFAEATGAAIVGFNVSASKDAKLYSEQKGITLKSYNIIYELIEGVKEEMSHLLEPEVSRVEGGELKVLAIFRKESGRMIVGGKVTKGKVARGSKVEVMREGEAVGEGKINQLKQGQVAQDEVSSGKEAGILFEGSVRIEEGDILLAFKEEKVYPEL